MHDYSLSLIAPKELAEKATLLSAKLNLNFGTFIPHVTLAWIEAGGIAGIKVSPNEEVALQVRGLYGDIDEEGRVWVGAIISETAELNELRSSYTRKHNIAAADDYFPHLTLGCIQKDDVARINTAAFSMIEDINGTYDFTLHLCKNGEFGKVVEIL